MRIIDSLGNIGFPEAIDMLIETLKNDDKNIRIFSIKALVKLNATKAIDILEFKKNFDPEFKVRQESEKALKKLNEHGN